MLPVADWWDFLNPFTYLAGAAGKVVADGWTAAMLGLWNAGLWALRLVLNLMDAFLTPDVAQDGPGAAVYRATFWVAGVLVLALAMVQLGVAAARRDGSSLARVAVGVGQFTIVWAGWIAYGVAVVAACGGLTRALLQTLLRVGSWSAWQPWQPFGTQDVADGTVATVLGLMGLLLWLAAVGHLLVMLARGGALPVLVATTPISAAGLVSDAGRSWIWKSLRWFHAAAFTPVLMVLVLGVGVALTTGVANGLAAGTQAAIGTALPGVVLILISSVAPLALFKLLAFVDPGTSSGAALRQGMAAAGGLQGLLAGRPSGPTGGSGAASATDEHGRSAGESAGEEATTGRFDAAERGLLAKVGGAAGTVAAHGLGVAATVGARGAVIGADLTNQMGVGHHSYHPDFAAAGPRRDGGRPPQPPGRGEDDTPDVHAPQPGDDGPPGAAPGTGQALPGPNLPPPTPAAAGSGPTGGGGGAAAAAGPGEAAAAVPAVPV